jgi:hypothetical protein
MGTQRYYNCFVMPALVAGIHAFSNRTAAKAWMAGTSPAMTTVERVKPAHEGRG